MPENPMGLSPPTSAAANLTTTTTTTATTPSSSISSSSVFASIFASSTISKPSQPPPSSFSNLISALARSDCSTSAIEPTSLSLASSLYLSTNGSSLFPTPDQDHHRYTPSPHPAMSATALLQKAAQMGAAASNPSLLRGLGLAVSSSSSGQDSDVKLESNSVAAGLGLGIPSGDVLMGQSALFGSKPTTLDLLGLGIGVGGTSTSELSALLTSFGGGGFHVGAAASYGGGRGSSPGETWDGGPERKPNGPTLL